MLTREQRIRTIVETLRPADPGSWEPNIVYVTAEFDSYDAAVTQERDELRQSASVYRDKHAYQWHDDAMANLKAWHEEVDGLKQQLAEVMQERDGLKEEVEVGLQLTGSFFEALKPLKLSAIHVQNPGRHITDLITQLAAMTQSCHRYKVKLEEALECLGYPVPCAIPSHTLKCGLCEARAQQLDTAHRDTFKTLMKEFDKRFYVTDTRLDRTRDYRVDEFYRWCREQANTETS